MIELFLKHHLQQIKQGVKYNAIENCHVTGLHSIVLSQNPDGKGLIRIYMTTEDHQLWLNDLGDPKDPMSVALHAHHCDLTFMGLYGSIYNMVGGVVPHPNGNYREMLYQSALRGDTPLLTPTGRRGHMLHISNKSHWLAPRQPFEMPAWLPHTVFVQAREQAAWMVFEGPEDPNYDPHCWTNDSNQPDWSQLYKPIDDPSWMLDQILSKI